MNQSLSTKELVTRIQSELTVGEKLLELSRQKKQAVIENNIDEITRLNKEEDETLHELEELGFERQELILEYTKKHGLRVTERLRDLIPQIETENIQESLGQAREKLVRVYGQIAEATQLNGELIAQSINITKQLFDRLSHVDRRSKNANYDRFKGKGTSKTYSPPSFNHQG